MPDSPARRPRPARGTRPRAWRRPAPTARPLARHQCAIGTATAEGGPSSTPFAFQSLRGRAAFRPCARLESTDGDKRPQYDKCHRVPPGARLSPERRHPSPSPRHLRGRVGAAEPVGEGVACREVGEGRGLRAPDQAQVRHLAVAEGGLSTPWQRPPHSIPSRMVQAQAGRPPTLSCQCHTPHLARCFPMGGADCNANTPPPR